MCVYSLCVVCEEYEGSMCACDVCGPYGVPCGVHGCQSAYVYDVWMERERVYLRGG